MIVTNITADISLSAAFHNTILTDISVPGPFRVYQEYEQQ